MATFVRIVLPVFVLAAAGLVWFLLNGAEPRAERVEPAAVPEVRQEGEPEPAAPPAPVRKPDARVVPPIPAEHLAPPLDAVEKGPGALVLHVVDRETGEKLRSTVQLWRLDAPANMRWTRGDQLQEVRQAPQGDTRFDDLPAGRYRVFVEEERADAPGDHEVEVGDGVAEETVEIMRAGSWPIRLRVLWDDGERVERGSGGLKSSWFEVPPMRWPGMAPRARLDGGPVAAPPDPDRLLMQVALPDQREKTDEGDGFLLGTAGENRKGRRWVHQFGFEAEGCVPVSFSVPGDLDGPRMYGAPAVPIKPVLGAVRMPDGTPASEAGVMVEATVGAIELFNEADEAGLRRLEVRLKVATYGFKPVDVRFPADGRPPTIYLEPAE